MAQVRIPDKLMSELRREQKTLLNLDFGVSMSAVVAIRMAIDVMKDLAGKGDYGAINLLARATDRHHEGDLIGQTKFQFKENKDGTKRD